MKKLLLLITILISIPVIVWAVAGGNGKAQGNSCMSQCMGTNAEFYDAANELTQACQQECNVGTGEGACLTTEDGCCVPYTDDPDCVVQCPCWNTPPDAYFCSTSPMGLDCSDGTCYLVGWDSNGGGRIRAQATLYGNDLCEDLSQGVWIYGISDEEAQVCIDIMLEGPNCNPPICGNGIVEGTETCDNGQDNTNTPCTPTYDVSCTYCDLTCTETTVGTCGNGIVEGTENCDDGNLQDEDACSSTCNCADPDGGKNIFEGGWTTTSGGGIGDVCHITLYPNSIGERFCIGDSIETEWIPCPSGTQPTGHGCINPGSGERAHCEPLGCTSNSDCSEDEYCQKPSGDCSGTGTCELKPLACVKILDPVCGCDGNTYQNYCYAPKAGVNIDYEGMCTS